MTYTITLQSATEEKIIGRLVGDMKEHIAIRVAQDRHERYYVLAISTSDHAMASQFVTWQGGFQGGHLATFWGHYFTNFDQANADFEERVGRSA